MLELAIMLLQARNTADPTAVGLFRFFAGFVLILAIYISALAFTYWISKGE